MKPTVETEQRKFNAFLYFSAIIANLTSFSLGNTYAWSSPAIPRLNGQIDPKHNPLQSNITPYQESWIASFVPLGSAISAFVSGYLSDKIGRKATLLASAIPTIAGFAILTFSTEVYLFYIGRLLCGLGSGVPFTLIPVYIAEISEKTNRGRLGCFFILFMSLGCLHIYLQTPFITVISLSASNLVIPVIFLIVFGLFVPESPYYYASKNQISLARKALLKLRYNDEEIVRKELPLIVKNVEESFSSKISIKETIRDPLLRKAFGISLGLMCFQQWSGINAIFFYMQSIFEETGTTISSDMCVILAGILQLAASLCTLPTVDRFGRRVLLLTSGVGNALTQFSTGIYFYLKDSTTVDVTTVSILPVITISLYILTYALGFGPVAYTMIGELFPPHVKSLAATVNTVVCILSIFCLSNLVPILRESMGLGFTFCFLGLMCTLGTIFVYIKIPETKGKRLEEVQEMLR